MTACTTNPTPTEAEKSSATQWMALALAAMDALTSASAAQAEIRTPTKTATVSATPTLTVNDTRECTLVPQSCGSPVPSLPPRPPLSLSDPGRAPDQAERWLRNVGDAVRA